MSSLTHAGDATVAPPSDFARSTEKKNDDATDVIERERKRTRPSVALNWDDVEKDEMRNVFPANYAAR